MPKLAEIESKLMAINQATFQTLCDKYIYFSEPGYPEIQRSGSQKGKNKTIKGRPDSYYQRENGQFVFIEHTTQARTGTGRALIEKIKKDLTECMDEQLTGIPLQNIDKIIYCFNSNITPAERKELTDLCLQKRIPLELKTLDSFSMGISGRFTWLSGEFLELSIDTGQVLPPETFITEYEASSLATPLSTVFIARDNELEGLERSVGTGKISIICGPPGTGKTRLALAALEKIQMSSPGKVVCFCLSDKNRPIHDDLRSYLRDDNPCVLFIDDANRQSGNLKSVLPFLHEIRQHPVHLIITVRDYALYEIKGHCDAYSPTVIPLTKMTEEELTILLKSQAFQIVNPLFVRRILEIANGNPRLAVMAARVAIDEDSLQALGDVSDLYDRYFSQAIDPSVFSNPVLLQTMGIVSFFHHINLTDTAFCERIFQNFGISKHAFTEACLQLERLELLDSDSNDLIFRIGEQTLGTYFFYRSFFKEKVLDFGLIMTKYFDNHSGRVLDTVIPANNIFGYTNVCAKLKPFLTRYWALISDEEEKMFKFLDIFWYFRMTDVLWFVNEKINDLSDVPISAFAFDEKEAQRSYYKNDRYLTLLSKCYSYPMGELEDALDLSFKYVRKVPELYNSLIRYLRELFQFRQEDELSGFYRQQILLEYLCSDDNFKNQMVVQAFFDILPELLKMKYRSSIWSSTRNTITIQHYTLSLLEPIEKFRKGCWEYLLKRADGDLRAIEKFLYAFLEKDTEKEKQIYQYDLSFISKMAEENFSRDSFVQCYLVQSAVAIAKRFEISNNALHKLEEQFKGESYRIYNLLRHDRLADKHQYDYSYTAEEYQILKEDEIRNFFQFATLADFKKFYLLYCEISTWAESRQETFIWSLDIILEAVLIQDIYLGAAYLKEIILSGNSSRYTPWRACREIFKEGNEEVCQDIYDLLIMSDFLAKPIWILNFLHFMPAVNITMGVIEEVINIYRQPSLEMYVDFESWEKCLTVAPEFYLQVLKEIYITNKERQGAIRLRPELFVEKIDRLEQDRSLLSRSYLQQQSLANHFDHNYRGFLEILRRNDGFLGEYLSFWTSSAFRSRTQEGLSIIWELEGAEKILWKAFDDSLTEEKYYVTHNILTSFFHKVRQAQSDRAFSFLKDYLTANKMNLHKVNSVFECIRQNYFEKLEEIILHFLAINSDFSIFTAIHWTSGSYVGKGDMSVANLQGDEYARILTIVNKIPKKAYKYAKHIAFLEERVAECRRREERERKDRFMFQEF